MSQASSPSFRELKLPDSRKFEMLIDPARMSHNYILEGFEADGLYEYETSLFVIKYMPKEGVFVDVGAHCGYFSLLAKKLAPEYGSVFAFEPNEENFSQLHSNMLRNHLYLRTSNAAVGAFEGEREMFVNLDNDGGHAFWKVSDLDFHKKTRVARNPTQKVKVTTLDGFFANEAPVSRIDILKIDVEGCEVEVLSGAQNLLKNQLIRFVIAEINEYALKQMGTTSGRIRSIMRNHGYKEYVWIDGKMVEMTPKTRVASNSVYNMFFACKGEEIILARD